MHINLKNLHQATAQQVFDQIVNHLRKQGCKSEGHPGQCLYRGPNNTKCAAGCLIDDDEYKREFEGMTWKSLVEQFNINCPDIKLISALQHIHDGADVCEWERLFHIVAETYNLHYTSP